MAIYKNMDIKISNEQAMFNEKFYVYQNDRGIDLYIKISMSRLQIGNKNISLLSELEGATAAATILKPNNTIIGRSELEIVDDTLRFTIDKTLTDELDEIGMYKLQFHLYDGQNNRITIPPVEFEVKQLIGLASDIV